MFYTKQLEHYKKIDILENIFYENVCESVIVFFYSIFKDIRQGWHGNWEKSEFT